MKKLFLKIGALLVILGLLFVIKKPALENKTTNTKYQYLGEKKGVRWIDTQVDKMGLRNAPIVKQDAYSTHFMLPDGKVQAVFTGFKQNYEISPNQWEPIDYSLVKSDDPNYDFKTKNGVGIYLSQNGSIMQKDKNQKVGPPKLGWYNIEKDTFTPLENLYNPKIETKDNQLIMQGSGVHLVINAYDLGAQEDLVIENTNLLKTGRPWEELTLKAEVSAENNLTINGKSPKNFQELFERDVLILNSGEKTIFPFPLGHDAKENNAPVRRFLKKEDGKWVLYTSTSYSWLNRKTRVYPVTIDPDYTGSTGDGEVQGSNATYSTARSTSCSGCVDTTSTYFVVGQYKDSIGPYNVLRGYLKFDTSSIPDTSPINSAVLKLVATTDYSATDFNVQIVKQNWSSQDPLASGNQEAAYDNCLSGTLDQVWKATSAMSINTQYSSPGLDTTQVSVTGSTYFCLRSSRDAAGNTPAQSVFEMIYIAAAENATSGYRPVLTVAYTSPPTAPTIGTPTAPPSFDATGGTITTSGGYTIHTFTTSGTFTPSGSGNVDYLVVAGGGGGGYNGAGGGGAGGMLTGSLAVTAQGYAITVGGGGAGSSSGTGSNGNNSVFSSVTATGGGGGGHYLNVGGNSGGSGGGGGSVAGGGNGTSGQGYGGGTGTGSPSYRGGGGGGAGGAGVNGSSTGNGGNGLSSSISGSAVTYAGGGGGSTDTTGPGSGGSGGGGTGGTYLGSAATAGTANTGGGGGGGYTAPGGADGGSGIVIIRYIPIASDPYTSIRWNFTDNASDETGFKVYDTNNNLVATCATANISYCDETGLAPGTQYTRKVVAYNAAGNSSYSSTAVATTTAVPAPTIGTPTALSTTSIRWNFTDNSSNETGFKVYDGSNNLVVTCATANLTYCDETGLSVNTQYTRKVVAYIATGNSSYSSTATIYTKANAPSTPTVSSAGSTTANVIIAVNSNPSTTEFEIQETGSLNFVNKTTGALGAASWGTYSEFGSGSGITVTGLSINTQYTFKVRARNGDNTATSYSSTASVYTLAATPPAPTVNVRATSTTQPVVVNAGSNPSNTTFALYKEVGTTCDGSGGSYIAADGSDNASTAVYQTVANWGTKTVTGLSQDQPYAFCVVANNGDNITSSFGSAASYNSGVPGLSGDHTITQDSSFQSFTNGNNAARVVDGVDTGTGSINTAKLIVQSGILTVNANETVAAGEFDLTGGSIAIATGGELKPGMPVWVVDADADGFPAVKNKLYAQTSAPTNGRRRNLMTRISVTDCDDNDASLTLCYKKPVTISYAGTTLTNYNVLISADTASLISAGKMTSDCGDIRMKDSDGTTNLTYWIEGGCNTTSTQIWVTVPSIPNGGKTIYMRYDPNVTTNGFSSWAGSFILMYNASCPANWVTNHSFDNEFPQGAATFGGTGGASSHSHAQLNVTSGAPDSTVPGRAGLGSAGQAATTTHTHTGVKVDVNTANSVLPPYLDVVFCKRVNLIIPANFIAMFDTSVPSGWTRFSALDNTFPRGALTTYGGTGGATTHSHSLTGGYVSSNASATVGVPSACAEGYDAGSHTHTTPNGTTDAANNTPPYLDMVFGQANAQTMATTGLIAITDVIPPLGWTRFTALDSKFPRGASSYGGTGGTTTHTHSVTIAAGPRSADLSITRCNDSNPVARGHSHTATTTTDSQSNIPPYTNAIYIKRDSPTPTTAVGSESVGP